MAYIKRSPIWPDPRVKPPFGSARLNPSHELAYKLTACWNLNEYGSRTIFEAATNDPGTLTNAPAWGVTPFGNGVRLISASDQYVNCQNPPNLQITDDITVMMDYMVGSDFSSTRELLTKDKDTGGRAYTLDILDTAGARFYINGGGGNDLVAESVVPAIYTRKRAYGSYRTSDKLISLYVDGKKVAEKTATTSGIPTATANVLLGRREYVGYTNPFDGWILRAMIWNRKLQDSEIAAVQAEPYSMFQPIIRRRYVVPAAGYDPSVLLSAGPIQLIESGGMVGRVYQ